MNLKSEIIIWPKRYKKIPHPFYVIRCDEHFMVVILDDKFNLVDELTGIHCDPYRARRIAFKIIEDSPDLLLRDKP